MAFVGDDSEKRKLDEGIKAIKLEASQARIALEQAHITTLDRAIERYVGIGTMPILVRTLKTRERRAYLRGRAQGYSEAKAERNCPLRRFKLADFILRTLVKI